VAAASISWRNGEARSRENVMKGVAVAGGLSANRRRGVSGSSCNGNHHRNRRLNAMTSVA